MIRRFICCFVLAIALYSAFAAGSNEVQVEGPTEIEAWYALSGASGEKFVELAEEFNESQDKIHVNLTYSGSYADTAAKVSAAMISGTNPDVAIMAAGQLYTAGKGNYDMDSFINDADFDVGDIFEGMMNYGRFEDHQGAVPFGISTPVIYYNMDLLEAAGIDMDNPPKTWSEFCKIAQKVMEYGRSTGIVDFYGFDTSDSVWLFKSMLFQNGNEVVVLDEGEVVPVFGNEDAIEVAEFWKGLISSGIMPASQHSNAEKKFLGGSLAFISASSNRIMKWKGNTEFRLGAIPMPYFESPSVALGGCVATVLTEDEEKALAGWSFLKYMLSEEVQTEFALSTGYLPIRKSAMSSSAVAEALEQNELFDVSFGQLENSWTYFHFDEMGTMDGIIYSAIDEIEKGVKTPEEALADAVESLEREMM